MDLKQHLNHYELHFAPLQGYTDRIYRNAFCKYFNGVDAFYTPFIRVEGKELLRNKDLRDIAPAGNAVPGLIPQILPGSPDELRLLANLWIDKGYRIADINLGCPFPMIVKRKKGAGMLPYPDKINELFESINEYPSIKFSVKMRLGMENESEWERLIHSMNDARLGHVTVHARTGKQQYKGNPDIETFKAFYEKCHLPLFYNGDLRTKRDIDTILSQCPLLKGVCIGRGLLANPLLAGEFKNETFCGSERNELYLKFHQELFNNYSEVMQGESQLILKMKSLWDYFLPETDKKVLKKIKKSSSVRDYLSVVKSIFYA